MIKSNNNLFTHRINVRIDDINFGNHLCHTKFINLIHNARALFLKKNNLSELDCFGYSLIILNINVNYLSQCYFDDELEINIIKGEINKATFCLSYTIKNLTTDKLALKAESSMAFIDLTSGKLKKIPEEFINLLMN